jgi:hypothetical protein
MKPFHGVPPHFREMPWISSADGENQSEAAAPQSLRFCCRNRPMRQQAADKLQVFSRSASPNARQTNAVDCGFLHLWQVTHLLCQITLLNVRT